MDDRRLGLEYCLCFRLNGVQRGSLPALEEYEPLESISIYGAPKLADKTRLSAFAPTHRRVVWNFRFTNIVGSRLRGAVVPDFIRKLRENLDRLRILGDGQQEKSYMNVTEYFDAMEYVFNGAADPMNTFNLGSRTTTSVNRIAEIVSNELDLNPEYEYAGTEWR